MTEAADMTGQGLDDADWWNGPKARVFISCGQANAGEKELAREIRDMVRDLGYIPYLAFEAHSSKALTDGIYAHLRTAEYFLFVDFRRERLGAWGKHRGSLFSNQELGIASYLALDSLYFVEIGVERRAGILGAIQGNPIEFSDRSKLVDSIRKEIAVGAWRPTSRRELRVVRDPTQFERAAAPAEVFGRAAGAGQRVAVRYYHVALQNLHDRILASDCRVQIIEIRNITVGKVTRPDPVESKFKHITWPAISLPPGTQREFDAVIVPEDPPRMAVLGIVNFPYIDSMSAIQQYTLSGVGDYEIDLAVFSRDFGPVLLTLALHLDSSINGVRLLLKSSSAGGP